MSKPNKLYSLLNHSKQDSSGIAPLRKDGQALLTETAKANALNDQFQSVFSPKTHISLKSLAQKSLQDLHDSDANPPLQPSPHPKMHDISITESIEKLLVGLNPHKAAGSDQFKPIVLQTLHKELAPILQLIFQRSLDTENYLTCVLCTVLEHIVASSMAKPFTYLDKLYDLQHEFREKRSCQTQPIMLVDELAKICRWANRLILFSWTLVKHLTSCP